MVRVWKIGSWPRWPGNKNSQKNKQEFINKYALRHDFVAVGYTGCDANNKNKIQIRKMCNNCKCYRKRCSDEFINFTKEIKKDDIILLYNRRSAYVGEVIRPHYQTKSKPHHRIKVNWLYNKMPKKVDFSMWNDTIHEVMDKDLSKIQDKKLRKFLAEKMRKATLYSKVNVTASNKTTKSMKVTRNRLKDYFKTEYPHFDSQSVVIIKKDNGKLISSYKSHQYVLKILAKTLEINGFKLEQDKRCDLIARKGSITYLFEVKSVRKYNIEDQLKIGIMQLYIYKYFNKNLLRHAKLVLVLEMRPSPTWRKFIEDDRGIFLLWISKGKLKAGKKAAREFTFLTNRQK